MTDDRVPLHAYVATTERLGSAPVRTIGRCLRRNRMSITLGTKGGVLRAPHGTYRLATPEEAFHFEAPDLARIDDPSVLRVQDHALLDVEGHDEPFPVIVMYVDELTCRVWHHPLADQLRRLDAGLPIRQTVARSRVREA